MMSEIPQSKEDLELRHHIVHYTFLPMVGVVILTTVSPIVLWPLEHVPFSVGLIVPWLSLLGACLYIMFLGDYVIPRETYRKLRSGGWGDSE